MFRKQQFQSNKPAFVWTEQRQRKFCVWKAGFGLRFEPKPSEKKTEATLRYDSLRVAGSVFPYMPCLKGSKKAPLTPPNFPLMTRNVH